MPKRSALYPQGAGSYAGGVGTADSARGNVLLPPSAQPRFGVDWSSAHTWAWIWGVALPVGWLFFRYFIHGGRRGGVI